MGTNFYFKNNHDFDNGHIGKRSASGRWCYRCDLSLCKGGKEAVHYDSHGWYDKCPSCGDGGEDGKPGGSVRGSCSFTWAVSPDKWKEIARLIGDCPHCGRKFDDDGEATEKPIVDEYGRSLSIDEFEEVVNDCKIHFFDSIGKYFS